MLLQGIPPPQVTFTRVQWKHSGKALLTSPALRWERTLGNCERCCFITDIPICLRYCVYWYTDMFVSFAYDLHLIFTVIHRIRFRCVVTDCVCLREFCIPGDIKMHFWRWTRDNGGIAAAKQSGVINYIEIIKINLIATGTESFANWKWGETQLKNNKKSLRRKKNF